MYVLSKEQTEIELGTRKRQWTKRYNVNNSKQKKNMLQYFKWSKTKIRFILTEFEGYVCFTCNMGLAEKCLSKFSVSIRLNAFKLQFSKFS